MFPCFIQVTFDPEDFFVFHISCETKFYLKSAHLSRSYCVNIVGFYSFVSRGDLDLHSGDPNTTL